MIMKAEDDHRPLLPLEFECALLEEALSADGDESLQDLPILPPVGTLERQQPVEEAAVLEPPPPDTNDIVIGVLPPRPQRMVFGAEAAEAAAVERAPQPAGQDLPDRVSTAQDESGGPRRPKTPGRTEVAADADAVPIAAWGFVWGAAYSTVLVALAAGWLDRLLPPLSPAVGSVDPQILVGAIAWGGIGGVMALLYHLWKEAHQPHGLRPFVTYAGKPFLGAALGAAAYMALELLVLGLGTWRVVTGASGEVPAMPAILRWATYALAWWIGFQEERVLAALERIAQRTVPGLRAMPVSRPPV